jgi:hypothetical protein
VAVTAHPKVLDHHDLAAGSGIQQPKRHCQLLVVEPHQRLRSLLLYVFPALLHPQLLLHHLFQPDDEFINPLCLRVRVVVSHEEMNLPLVPDIAAVELRLEASLPHHCPHCSHTAQLSCVCVYVRHEHIVAHIAWFVGTLKIGYPRIQALSQDKEQGVHSRAAT